VTTYLSPGVYIEEVPSGPQPIAAAPTSVLAIVGSTTKGPYMTPTRLAGWADFERTFGRSAAGGYTAEAVYGYFENGGPAVYVVRVDPSTLAQWTVRDSAAATVFLASASSPGEWANGIDVSVAPDLTGGSGQTYLANVKTAVKLQAAATDVDVTSTQGIEVGDTVIVIGTTGTANATVNDKGAGTIKITKSTGPDFDVVVGDVIATRADPAATSMRLGVANGFKVGDVLLVEQPNRTRRTAIITGVAPGDTGTLLTLQGGFGNLVPGAEFADRTRRFRGQVAPTDANIPLSAITWSEPAGLEPATDDIPTNNFRAFAANGLQGQWNANRFEFGAATPPKGQIEVEAVVKVHVFSEQIELTNPSLADLATRYSFVPDGTDLVLSDGTNTATLTRTAGGFTNAGTLNRTFTSATFKLPNPASKGVVVRSVQKPAVDDYVAFGNSPDNLLRITGVDARGGTLYVLSFADAIAANISTVAGAKFALRGFQASRFQPLRFKLAVTQGDATLEEYRNLALDPSHPQYYFKDGIINKVSPRITVGERPTTAGAISETTMPASVTRTQSGASVVAQSSDHRKGFETLEAETEPAMVICPDALTLEDPLLQVAVMGSMVGHCERFRRYAIVDGPNIANDQDLVAWRNASVDSTYAGVFAPHVKIVNLDPDAVDRFRTVPPSGFVAGVFARTDRERGVHKAPGNERLRGIVGLAENYTTGRQDLLNPVGLNLIRAFPQRGTRLWGARNATDDVTWRYVNVRRLFNMIETSVERGTQWVVFEPNTRATWLRVKVSMENFLDQQWRAGALAGASAAEAYRVRVGLGETMSETDVDLGLIVIEVAIAPAKPAEFVVFRFSHKRLAE
jgi:uncharacterized protein